MFPRIVRSQGILGGKPIIRGTRISVEMILEWTASGATRDDIVRNYPPLTSEDVERAQPVVRSGASGSFRGDCGGWDRNCPKFAGDNATCYGAKPLKHSNTTASFSATPCMI